MKGRLIKRTRNSLLLKNEAWLLYQQKKGPQCASKCECGNLRWRALVQHMCAQPRITLLLYSCIIISAFVARSPKPGLWFLGCLDGGPRGIWEDLLCSRRTLTLAIRQT
jgi:hypothetical protein